jgi:hypothetical protein
MSEILCNCFHSKLDHHILEVYDTGAQTLFGWCVYSEYGQCPCDSFTPMDNLEYLEYEDAKRNKQDL